MSTEEIDLTAFPVLRLDQIKIIDSSILKKAEIELNDLIKSSLDDHHHANHFGDISRETDPQLDPPFVKYLRKLVNAITNELTQRVANTRIQELLLYPSIDSDVQRGVYDSIRGNNDEGRSGKSIMTQSSTIRSDNRNSVINNTVITARCTADSPSYITNTSALTTSTSNKVAIPFPVASAAFKPLPLPSQLKRQSTLASKARDTTVDSIKNDTEIRTSSSATTGLISSRSINGLDDNGNNSQYQYHNVNSDTDDNTTQSTAISIKSTSAIEKSFFNTHTQRPQSGSAASTRPSRKALNVVNQNFGKAFIVAGEGKKRRPAVVKRATEESEEEIKARERADRLELMMMVVRMMMVVVTMIMVMMMMMMMVVRMMMVMMMTIMVIVASKYIIHSSIVL
jgi:hypothetical protein